MDRVFLAHCCTMSCDFNHLLEGVLPTGNSPSAVQENSLDKIEAALGEK
jgi:hypothetical protein